MYPVPAGAVNTTDPPVHNVIGPPGVIVAEGWATTVTVVGALTAEQVPSETVTVKVPLVVTVIDRVVAAVDHK